MKQIKMQYAAQAVDTALHFLYEAGRLNDAVESIQEYHGNGDCEDAHDQVEVLRRVAGQKLEEVFDALIFANDYFSRQAKPKAKKKKLAVVEAA